MQELSANGEDSSRISMGQPVGARRFRSFRVIAALILRETGSRETSASLGFLWTIIDPIATMALLSFVFSMLMRQPQLGTNFQLFYVTGIGPFHLYTQVQSRVSGSIRFSRSLLGFPAVTVLDALMARFILNTFMNVVVYFAMVYGVISYYGLREQPDYPLVLLSLTMAAALGLGIGTLNSVLFLASPTWESVFNILNRPLSIASGLMFVVSALPDKLFYYLWWNPLVHVVDTMRAAFYPSFEANYVSPGYIFLISGICFTLGLVGLHSYVFDALEK